LRRSERKNREKQIFGIFHKDFTQKSHKKTNMRVKFHKKRWSYLTTKIATFVPENDFTEKRLIFLAKGIAKEVLL
jgi:hypothetical protein